MITLSELQIKEVIMIHSGLRLGYIDDLEIDITAGKIIALIIMDKNMKGALFKKPCEQIVYWEQIVTIGEDVILVDIEKNQQKPTEN